MKKTIGKLLSVMLIVGCMTGCGASKEAASVTGDSEKSASGTEVAQTTEKEGTSFDPSAEITVVSREDGSGTRGAFIELVGVEQKDADGNKVDHTTEEAIITNNTSVMMTTVAGDINAIGYISLGSLNDTVKAVDIDGVEPTVENIKNDSYKVSRPFNIATKGEVAGVQKDFINFIMSKEGQKVIEDNGYIAVNDAAESFTTSGEAGKIVVAGSSSVTPVMEKLKEAYLALNSAAEIEIQESDSTTGMTAAMEGTCDIGMASRELKDSELEGGLTNIVIAKDGIAVIVNNDNTTEALTSESVKDAYTGDATTWEELQ